MSAEIRVAKTVGDIIDRLYETEAFAYGLWLAIKGHSEMTGNDEEGLYALADVLCERIGEIRERLDEITDAQTEAPAAPAQARRRRLKVVS